ncbi:MAG: pyridoxine 5'-phosphate synthase [Planctomycetota bacterium]
MVKLFVNVDHIATVREARQGKKPSPFEAAKLALLAGADGITMHLREDRRHVQDHDLREFAARGEAPLNFELAAVDEILDLCCELRPPLATLVPERREEVTTEGGLDLVGHSDRIQAATQRLQAAGIAVSLFIDPTPQSVEKSHDLGADIVELHTGSYTDAPDEESRAKRLAAICEAAALTVQAKLVLNAGHGLDTTSVGKVAALPQLADLNIGHAIVSRALMVGMAEAVREMRQAIDAAQG